MRREHERLRGDRVRDRRAVVGGGEDHPRREDRERDQARVQRPSSIPDQQVGVRGRDPEHEVGSREQRQTKRDPAARVVAAEHVVDAAEQHGDGDLGLHARDPVEDLVLVESEVGEREPGRPRPELQLAHDPVGVDRREHERRQRDEPDQQQASAVGDELARERDQHRERRGEALNVARVEVMDEADAVGDVLVVLERDQRVVEAAVGDRPVDDPRREPDDDRAAEQRALAQPPECLARARRSRRRRRAHCPSVPARAGWRRSTVKSWSTFSRWTPQWSSDVTGCGSRKRRTGL